MKTHLADSSVPLTEGQDQIAICGAEVKQAAFAWQWRDGEKPEDRYDLEYNSGGLCMKCLRKGYRETSRYIYGITEGENLRRRGEVEA